MTEPKAPLSLDELDAKLRRARQEAGGDRAAGAAPAKALGVGFRVGIELVVALVVGVGIGYFLDVWLGTKPWLMLVFFVLGTGAGIVNVWRVVTGLDQAVGYRGETGEAASKTGSDDGGGSRSR